MKMEISKLKSPSFRKGGTLLEILIVIVIMSILSVITYVSFVNLNKSEALNKQAAGVVSLVKEARSETLSSKGALAYGVHFETTKAVLFQAPTYSSGSSSNITLTLNPLIQISSKSLTGGGAEVIFQRLTGKTSQDGTVTLSLISSASTTKSITVSKTGLAE